MRTFGTRVDGAVAFAALRLASPCAIPTGLVVRFLAYTGLRWGEMAALRLRDVDPLRRRMLIARSVTEDNGRLIFDTTKTGEERTSRRG